MCSVILLLYRCYILLFFFAYTWLFLLSVEQLNVSTLPRLSKTNYNTARTVKCTVLYCIVSNHIVMTTIITRIIIAIIYSYPWTVSHLPLLNVHGNIHLGHTSLVWIFRELCWWTSGQTEVLCSVWFRWEERASPSGACDRQLLCGQNRISQQKHDNYSAAANRWKWRWGTEMTVQIRWQVLAAWLILLQYSDMLVWFIPVETSWSRAVGHTLILDTAQ